MAAVKIVKKAHEVRDGDSIEPAVTPEEEAALAREEAQLQARSWWHRALDWFRNLWR